MLNLFGEPVDGGPPFTDAPQRSIQHAPRARLSAWWAGFPG
jgi:hypothetical protein